MASDMSSIEDPYLYFLICLALIIAGAVIVYATWRRVKFFVDPSADMLFVGTNLALKKLIGSKGLRIYWYCFGGFLLIMGFVGIVAGFGRFLR